jgi:sulfide:quinone oxidoreductase
MQGPLSISPTFGVAPKIVNASWIEFRSEIGSYADDRAKEPKQMDVRPISKDYAVAPQIAPEDIKAIAEAGYKSVICNRPDGEEPGQPDFAQIAEVAKSEGLDVRWIPIVGGPTPEAMEDFKAALNDMPGPLLAYCRSGTRSTMMWTLARFNDLADEEILRATREAGYDMSGVVMQLRQMQG